MQVLFGRLALLVGILAAILVFGAGPAYRFAGIDLMMAFGSMRWGVYAAGAVGVLAVLWLIFALIGRSGAGLAMVVVGVILAGVAAYFPISMMQKGQSVPPIHDITTDTVNPPAFVALKAAREASKNGGDYKTNPADQLKAYPDIETLVTETPLAEMFARAEKVAREMNWEIAAAVVEEGRIEATDTTAWWGFKDDIVIRITSDGATTRLDIRSMSRVGVSDLGKNAERIRAFLAKVKDAK